MKIIPTAFDFLLLSLFIRFKGNDSKSEVKEKKFVPRKRWERSYKRHQRGDEINMEEESIFSFPRDSL